MQPLSKWDQRSRWMVTIRLPGLPVAKIPWEKMDLSDKVHIWTHGLFDAIVLSQNAMVRSTQ